jgi:hypothetical protein
VVLVSVAKQVPPRLYGLEPKQLKRVPDGIKKYERFWTRLSTALSSGPERKMLDRVTKI